MANRYWISDVAANWNDTANWSTSSGGSGGASVPGSSDVAIFDAQGTGNCRLNAAIDVAGISFAGYTATLDGASDDLDHTVGTTGVVYSSGTPTFSLGDGTWTCSGHWDVRSVTVSYNSGTLVLSGASKNAYFNKDGTGTPDCNNVTVSGTITIPNVAYAVAKINGVLNITGTLTVSALPGRILDLGDGATATVQSGGVLTGAGTIRWNGFDSNTSGISTMAGTWSIARTEFWPRLGVPTITPASYGGLVLFDTANAVSAVSWVPSAGSYTFDDFTVDTALVTITINCSTNNPNITFTGDVSLSANAAWTKGTGTITFSGSADQTVDFDDVTIEDVVINKSAGTVTFSDGFTTDSFTLTAGTIAFGATPDTITSSGNWTIGTGGQVDPTNLDGWTWAVGGNLSLSGESGDLLNLVATAAWYLQVTGTATASYVNAAYSDASGYTEIDADDGTNTDGGNNVNWAFAAATGSTAYILGGGVF